MEILFGFISLLFTAISFSFFGYHIGNMDEKKARIDSYVDGWCDSAEFYNSEDSLKEWDFEEHRTN